MRSRIRSTQDFEALDLGANAIRQCDGVGVSMVLRQHGELRRCKAEEANGIENELRVGKELIYGADTCDQEWGNALARVFLLAKNKNKTITFLRDGNSTLS